VRESVASLKARVSQLTDTELTALHADGRAGVRAVATVEARRRQAVAREAARLDAMLAIERDYWRNGYALLAGVDEAGAGPWAGPVVAGAVILPPNLAIPGVNDSKQLTARQRERLGVVIRERAIAWAVGSCSAAEIDTIHIGEAARRAMKRAVDGLSPGPEHLLVDWRKIPDVAMSQTVLVRGDCRSHSIAAASIIAKTHRDALMAEAAEQYPGYGFESHVGYGTAAHRAALETLGACPLHRRSFKPVARLLGIPPGKPKKEQRARRKP
jgi:ribonuclease HII